MRLDGGSFSAARKRRLSHHCLSMEDGVYRGGEPFRLEGPSDPLDRAVSPSDRRRVSWCGDQDNPLSEKALEVARRMNPVHSIRDLREDVRTCELQRISEPAGLSGDLRSPPGRVDEV